MAREMPDKRKPLDGGRSDAEWAALSLEQLRAEWDARPKPKGPPYKVDREQYRRLTRVRSEIFARMSGKPPDGVTFGKGGRS